MEYLQRCGGDFMNVIHTFITNAPTLLICALVAMIVIDYITGLLRALYEKKTNSKLHYKGLIKKLSIIIGVLFGAVADIVISAGTPVFTSMMALLFIANEGLSIVENLGVMGVPIPKKLKDKLVQIKDSEGEKEND